MQQVPLPLMPRAEGRFESFIAGDNAAVVELLQAEIPPRTPHFLWGEGGSGKTHLLQALAARCAERGLRSAWFDPSTPLPWEWPAASALLLFDDVERLDAGRQQAAFALCVEAQGQGVAWVAAAAMPPVDLALREDLRTRLGWGQTHALQGLDDARTRAALRSEAQRRGIPLAPEVTDYLLSRFARDLGSLMRLLDALDRYSLARGRAVTVPLLRAMLSDGEPLDAGAAEADTPGDTARAPTGCDRCD